MNTWLRIKIQGLDQAPVPQTTQTSDPDPWSRHCQGSWSRPLERYNTGELMSSLVVVTCFFGVSVPWWRGSPWCEVSSWCLSPTFLDGFFKMPPKKGYYKAQLRPYRTRDHSKSCSEIIHPATTQATTCCKATAKLPNCTLHHTTPVHPL